MSRPWMQPVVTVVLSLFLMGAFVILYTAHAQEVADRRLCPILTIQGAADPPATTPRGRSLQEETRKLARAYGCEGIE